MKKRLLSGLVAVVLLFSMVPAALAVEDTQDEAAQVLAALEIMTGDQNGKLNLDNTITRAEFTKMAIAASKYKDGVGNTVSVSPFPDVPRTHWAAPWVKAAVDANLVRGSVYGKYEPNREITLAEGATIALRLLEYTDADFLGAYPTGQMAMFQALKLDKGILGQSDETMSRKDALNLFYNLLTAKAKSGGYYLNGVLAPLNLVNAAGEIDRVALINSAMEGPVVVESGWQSSLPFPADGAKVYRAGLASSLDAIQPMDVVYYSKSMRTLWAYDTRVTGTLEGVAPSVSAPASVTVAGKSYAIENTTAAFTLSDLGSFRVGDPVTLLLGRGGGVVAVRIPGKAVDTTLFGVVTAVTTGTYLDSNGNFYNADTIEVKSTGNVDYTYSTDEKNYKAGNLVRVTTENGVTQIKRLNIVKFSGRVNNEGTQIGRYKLASNIEILDTYGNGEALRVYPSRLAGMNLTDEMVKFYALNAKEEIEYLILNDATGDLHKFGILTNVEELTSEESVSIVSTYAYDIAGLVTVTPPMSRTFGVRNGPCELKIDGTTIDHISNLEEVKLDRVNDKIAISESDQKYTISDSVLVYQLKNSTYYYASLEHVVGGYTLTGYFDKAESDGGRIRVIVAKVN